MTMFVILPCGCRSEGTRGSAVWSPTGPQGARHGVLSTSGARGRWQLLRAGGESGRRRVQNLLVGAAPGPAQPLPPLPGSDRSLFSQVNTCCSNHSLAFPQVDVESMAELAEMRHLLMERVQGVMATCCEFRSSLERYSYLYMDDRKEFMRHFLQYGRGFSSQDVEAFAEESLPESTPTLENFREQVDRWVRLRRHVLLCNIWLGFLLRVPVGVKM